MVRVKVILPSCMFTFCYFFYFAVIRAKEAARQYRAEAGEKVHVAAKVSKAEAEKQKLAATLKTHQEKQEIVQQYHHDCNRATAKLDEAFAEIRTLQKLNKSLQKEAEMCKKR